MFYSYQGVRRRGEEAAKVSGLCLVRGWQVAGGRQSGGGGRRRSSLRKSVRDGAIKKVVKGRERERVEWSNQVGWRGGVADRGRP